MARGTIEAIAIDADGLLLRQNLRIEELQLQIGRVTVRPRRAVLGKIELVHPSEGTLRLVIRDEQLTTALNSHSSRQALQQHQGAGKPTLTQVEQLTCEAQANGAIAIRYHCKTRSPEDRPSGILITKPQIEANGNGVMLQLKSKAGQVLPPAIEAALMAQMSDIFSLRDLANRGTAFQIQQLDVSAGQVTVQAATYIERVPSG